MITVNKERCTGCMTCVKVCPFTVLGQQEGKPQMREGKACIKCMHCAAACPEKAISFGEGPAILDRELPKVSEHFREDLERHIVTRRSYRNFKDTPVDRTEIQHALELAAWAPSAKNQHPAKWIVVDSKETIKAMMNCILEYVKETGTSPEIVSEYENEGNNVVMGTAPTLILCYGRNNAINSPQDVAIAMTTAELVLQSRGIGTCWAGYLTRLSNAIPGIQALLPKLPENNSFYGAFMAGYPEGERYLHIPERMKRADIQWV